TGRRRLVRLDGPDPGHRFVPADPGAREYRLRGSAIGAMPLGRIEVVINGEVARTIKPVNRETGRAYESPIDEALTLDGTSWVAVRCFEDRPDGRVRFAHSGPFHVDVAARPLRPRRAQAEYLVHRVQVQIDRSAGVLPQPALDEYRQALGIYRKLLETAR